jgi:hypothetical protein
VDVLADFIADRTEEIVVDEGADNAVFVGFRLGVFFRVVFEYIFCK